MQQGHNIEYFSDQNSLSKGNPRTCLNFEVICLSNGTSTSDNYIHVVIVFQSLSCWNILVKLGQYHDCWWPGCVCHQVISIHCISYAWKTGSFLPRREYQSDVGSAKDTPYLALSGELWGVFCEYFWENWPHYNGTTQYNFMLPKINSAQQGPNYIWEFYPCPAFSTQLATIPRLTVYWQAS